MRSRHVQMTVEEYELLPFEPGWKCEYFNGCAHYTPRYQPVVTSMRVEPRPVETPLRFRPPRESDAEALVQPYVTSFGPTIEYCDYTPQQVEGAARRALHSHFCGERRVPHAASRVAVAAPRAGRRAKQNTARSADSDEPSGGTPIGAALLVTGEFGVMLDLLFVAAEHQRRGTATALVAAAMAELHRAGVPTLTSRYHIGNEQSRDWHRRFGFVELPDLTVARLYERAARQEQWRRTKLGDLTPADRARLAAECKHWRRQVKALEQLEAEQGYEAVHPNLRWW
jgi:RimJ/RimL family protein N-acetyltransferase